MIKPPHTADALPIPEASGRGPGGGVEKPVVFSGHAVGELPQNCRQARIMKSYTRQDAARVRKNISPIARRTYLDCRGWLIQTRTPDQLRRNLAKSEVALKGKIQPIINLCANNYLGLADHPEIIAAAKATLDKYGYGMASVRFICGTLDLHRELERVIADFLEMDDAILYAAAFDANGGVFEPLLTAEDAIISDSLNHASIIDGIRLCKAKRYRFENNNMADLETKLAEAAAASPRSIIIATDGVFSMDGAIANIPELRRLADVYDALLLVDDCHSTGILGPQGRGTAAHFGLNADIITGTLGKSLGGAAGGFVAAAQPVIDMLRQRSRPYLFSNSAATDAGRRRNQGD